MRGSRCTRRSREEEEDEERFRIIVCSFLHN